MFFFKKKMFFFKKICSIVSVYAFYHFEEKNKLGNFFENKKIHYFLQKICPTIYLDIIMEKINYKFLLVDIHI